MVWLWPKVSFLYLESGKGQDMNQKETMKNMPKSERPYEKCMEQGPQVLSDAELLAVILKNGTKVTDAEVLNGFQLNYSESFDQEWEKHDDGWYYYKNVLNPKERTKQTLVSVTMNKNISNDIHGNKTDYSGAGMDVDIECESIQTTVSKDSSELQNWDSYPVISGTDVSWVKK